MIEGLLEGLAFFNLFLHLFGSSTTIENHDLVFIFFREVVEAYGAFFKFVIRSGPLPLRINLLFPIQCLLDFGEARLDPADVGLLLEGLALAVEEEEARKNEQSQQQDRVDHDADTEHEVGDEPPLTVALRLLVLDYFGVGVGPHDHEAPHLNNHIDYPERICPSLHALEAIFYEKHRGVHLDDEPLEVRDLGLVLLGLHALGVTVLEFHALDPYVEDEVGSMLLNRHVAPHRENRKQINDQLHQILTDVNVNVAEGLLRQA